MATHDDAATIVQLQMWATQMGMDEAISHVMADDFDPESAALDDPAVWTLLSFGETVATLIKHDALDRDLVVDLWWIDGIWARLTSVANRMREQVGESRLYENFETLAKSSAG